jgi:hypothetical protein
MTSRQIQQPVTLASVAAMSQADRIKLFRAKCNSYLRNRRRRLHMGRRFPFQP